jgi:hypothetical protein
VIGTPAPPTLPATGCAFTPPYALTRFGLSSPHLTLREERFTPDLHLIYT